MFLISLVAVAQTNRGGITGTVFDGSGSVVSGASITLTNLGTNQVSQTVTNGSGSYSFASLDPVVYTLVVEQKGFEKYTVSQVKVDTATVSTVNVKLKVGVANYEIKVEGESTPVNTESGTNSQTITERQLYDTPLLNRSVLDLAITVPNISGSVGSEEPAVTSNATVPGYNLNINGGRAGSTVFLADGMNNTGVGLARAVATFSPETVQELTVSTSAYSAEYGSTGGGVVNITTKSGSNDYHGSVLWYTRNPSFNARQFQLPSANTAPANLRDNQFSATVGGPVRIPKLYNGHDRTFFFAAAEPRRRTDHIQATSCLPTDAMRGGDFSGLLQAKGSACWAPAAIVNQFGAATATPTTIYNQFNMVGNQFTAVAPVAFAGNVIPQNMLDPVSVKLLAYLPHAGSYFLDPTSGNLVNYTAFRNVQDNENRYTVRLDHIVSSRNNLNFRMTWIPTLGISNFDPNVPGQINGNGANYNVARQFVIGDTQTFSANKMNDLKIGYTRGRFSGTYSPQWDIKTGQNLSTQLGLPTLTTGGLPMFAFGLGSFGNIGSQGSTLNDNVEERYSFNDVFYLQHGNMSWKFGVEASHQLLNELSFFAASGGNYTFASTQTNSSNPAAGGTGGIPFASFLLGVPNAVTLNKGLLPYYYRWETFGGFVQNDWKIKHNLTLNLGVRYSLQLPRTEKFNHQGVFDLSKAQSFPLAVPKTLTPGDGTVITSALVPPFAFSGVGGNSKYLWPIEYDDFEPRVGFAWSPKFFKWNQDDRIVLRGGYGLAHLPLTGQNRLPNPQFAASTSPFNELSGQTNPTFVTRLSSNPPLVVPQTWNQILNIQPNGLTYLPSLLFGASGFVLAPNIHMPYAQNWNFTVDYRPAKKTTIEIAYVGAKGTHLFFPRQNVNQPTFSDVNALVAQNANPATLVADPLGRGITVPQDSLSAKYMGFGALYSFYNSGAYSMRHAGYISLIQRATKGLTLTANYTFSKSIDDASDSSPDKNAPEAQTSVSGQASFGGTVDSDRAVSQFDQKHVFSMTSLYDLPFGHGQRFLNSDSGWLNALVGGWSTAGIWRAHSSYPFLVTMADTNSLGDTAQTHTVRPNIVPGVPVLNPLWNPNCPMGGNCEPYLNPAAFMRPPAGTLGNAPRTIDNGRGPFQQFLDASIQKNFRIHQDGKFKIQLRLDLINALNHPTLAPTPNSSGSDLFSSAPSTVVMPVATYNGWAAANGLPLQSTPAGLAIYNQIVTMFNASKVGLALPANFYSVPLPQGFATKSANTYDVRTLDGYKLFMLRQAYNPTFGSLTSGLQTERYVQLGLKIIF